MSDVIHLLPDSVANQIAAGEVIQRPASVIKELVENAVDAGASEIKVYIRDAGRTLIQVVDNGCGMSETDVRMAFERHATSKIRQADDLFSLHTMGFRGEALPSICAISHVEVRTRREGDSIGTSLIINGSKVEEQQPAMCEKGTSISVKNLFFNVPARRKFLKSDNVELANVMREFERLALVNNHLRMSIDTGSKIIELRAGTFKQRIGELWKNNLSMTLLPVEIDTALVKISGFVSRPEFARRRNALQYLIVNGRNMRHPYFHKAILSCYESLIANDTQPCYFLKFEVDPSTIDVNIHPTKNEIKFENELEIRPLLVAAIRASLGKNAAVPSIDFTSAPVEVAPLSPGEHPQAPRIESTPGYNPFTSYNQGAKPQTRNWESLYTDFMSRSNTLQPDSPAISTAPVLPAMDEDSHTAICMQYALKYIITTTHEGVLLIDQHRAHVKVLYEEYMHKAELRQSPSQSVLFPETLMLEPALQAALHEVSDELRLLGFVLTPEGEGRWTVNAVPAVLGHTDPRDIVLRILESVSEDAVNYGAESGSRADILSRVTLLMARSAAMERGRKLSSVEMERLVTDLFSLPDPTFTPSGARIYTVLDENRISALLH